MWPGYVAFMCWELVCAVQHDLNAERAHFTVLTVTCDNNKMLTTKAKQQFVFLLNIHECVMKVFPRQNSCFSHTQIVVPRLSRKRGTLKLIRLSVLVYLSVTKTLTLLISSEVLMIEHWYLVCMILVTSPFNWHHAVTSTFDLLQGQSCYRAGDHNSPNLLVMFIFKDRTVAFHIPILLCLFLSYITNVYEMG